MKAFVVDASVAAKWFVPELHWAQANRLLDPEFVLHAPELLLAEIGNMFWKRVRRLELESQKASEVIQGLAGFRIELIRSQELIGMALDLAVFLDHPIYDCFYLAAAVERGAPVVTADARFATVVAKTRYARHIRWIEDDL